MSYFPPVEESRKYIKTEENKGLLHGYEFAIEDLKNAISNLTEDMEAGSAIGKLAAPVCVEFGEDLLAWLKVRLREFAGALADEEGAEDEDK